MRATLWLVVLVAAVVLVAVAFERQLPRVQPRFVISFSAAQARYLGLDALEVYNAALRDFRPQHLRLQANWNSIEPEAGIYDFVELDQFISAARTHGATVTLAIGRKLPRWPECHDPVWLKDFAPSEAEGRLMTMLRAVVEHYRTNPTVVRWQLENEPLFGFGRCLAPNRGLLVRERALLRELDATRPILITDSGELSPWIESALLADEQGVTMYRVTWNPIIRYFHYPWPPAFYRLKAALVAPFVQQVLVSELQLEPWAPSGLAVLSPQEAARSFGLHQFWQNVAFARATGLPEVFTWGVEWWYKERVEGRGELWEAAQLLFSRAP